MTVFATFNPRSSDPSSLFTPLASLFSPCTSLPSPFTSRTWILLLLAAILVAPAQGQSTDSTLAIGSKKFTESVILGEMVRLLIQSTGSSATGDTVSAPRNSSAATAP